MSDATDDERERIRERKLRELRERLEREGDGRSETGAARASGAATGGAPDEPIEIEGEDHLQRVVSAHPVVLVDCYAEWCGPCKMMEPTIEALAAETDAAVATVDVDAHQTLATRLGVRGVPTLVCFADGEPAERLVGAQDRATLEALVARHG
ncbi:co-chaperone YbbN [Halovivax sp.]|uniref:thioredoxin family protein n=1 Tax=Halovivax sp. TaxID=1935978 RepID=UPI0025C485B7|nr:thioredoxin domain-containing protein [Halovivax sp.]